MLANGLPSSSGVQPDNKPATASKGQASNRPYFR